MENLTRHRFARAVSSATAFRLHPKPVAASFVPPVIVRAGTTGQRSSIFINADSGRYADAIDGDVLRYRASVNRALNDALERLADARADVDIVAMVRKKFYVVRGNVTRTALPGFRGFDVHLRPVDAA